MSKCQTNDNITLWILLLRRLHYVVVETVVCGEKRNIQTCCTTWTHRQISTWMCEPLIVTSPVCHCSLEIRTKEITSPILQNRHPPDLKYRKALLMFSTESAPPKITPKHQSTRQSLQLSSVNNLCLFHKTYPFVSSSMPFVGYSCATS